MSSGVTAAAVGDERGDLGLKERAGELEVRGSNGRHKRNGSVSGGVLAAAPAHSPSFGSLGDTSAVEGHREPSHSDTFQGFEALAKDSPEAGNLTAPVEASPRGNRGASPSSGAPGALTPVIGNVDTSSSRGPYVSPKKIPGHELLKSLNQPSGAVTAPEAGSRGVGAVSEAMSGGSGRSGVAPREAAPVVVQPGADGASVAQPEAHDAPPSLAEEPTRVERERDAVQGVDRDDASRLPEESAAAVPVAGTLDGHTADSPVASTAGGFGTLEDGSTTEKVVDASNVATGSDGRIEEIAGKSTGDGIETTDEKEVGSVQPPETIAFRNVEAEKEVPSTGTSKPGSVGKLSTISTKKWRSPSDADLKAMVVIPEYLSKGMEDAVNTKGEANPEGPPAGEKIVAPACPILVFINSKSGGRLGPELLKHFEEIISSYQVYDLSKRSPSAVIQYGLRCLDRMANSGDECARRTREGLRILVAGGDGTVGWVLSSVGALRELPGTLTIPPVGVLPLGTGNDLSRSFGWGGEFSSTSTSALKRVLVKALGSKAAPLDTWNAVVMPAKSVAAADIAFPHAMHPQHHVPLPSSVVGEKHDKDERDPAFEGLFFNYFSIGMDAQVAYGFHHLRDEKPWLARGRTANQMIYSSFGCTQGWFCTACSVAPRARGVSNILKLWVRKRGSKDWQDIHLPSNIRAVVICNLKSYGGGRNPWGKPSSGRREKEGFEEQRYDDGLLEIMGLKDGWHSAFVLLEVSTAVRLCQAEAVKIELNGKSRKKAYLQMDGEPWLQPMGRPDDGPTVVMIEKLPHPSLLLKR